jgi:aldehyde dehydrogenase (NAD+)
MTNTDKLYIGGDWVAPRSSETFGVVSPHTEEVIATVAAGSTADIDAAVAAARTAFDEGPWARMTPAERADVLARLTEGYTARMGDLAQAITDEMGCPITFSQLGQVPMPLLMLQYYTDLARTFEFEDRRQGMLSSVIVRREPIGVAAAITAWNTPQFVAISKIAPALAAGCTVVLKVPPEAPLDAFILGEIAHEAGLPAGVLNIVPAGPEASEHLVSHPGVDTVAFTGSTVVGRKIAAACGALLRPVTLELGGKSAAIVLDDADLNVLAGGLELASFLNNGEACIAQTRILASRARYDEVVDTVASVAAGFQVGDPSDPATNVGPMVTARHRDRVESYIKLGQDEGAKIVTGGGRPAGQTQGWYVEPTVFSGVTNDMRVAREEIFGPVVCVIPYDDEADAIRIANDSDYGLAGSVWTADAAHGLDVARQVRTGTYGINAYLMDFVAPFGGYKASGLGREFGPEGLLEYLEHKTIAGVS